MSSILDALNKLEQDKAQAQRRAEGYEDDPVSAAQELVGRSVLHDRVTVRFSPLTLAAGAVVAVALLVVLSMGLSLMLFGTGDQDAASPVEALPVAATPAIAKDSVPLVATNQEVVASTVAPDAAPTELPAKAIVAAPPNTADEETPVAETNSDPAPLPAVQHALTPEPEPVEEPAPPVTRAVDPIPETVVAQPRPQIIEADPLPERDMIAQVPRETSTPLSRIETPAEPPVEELDRPLHLLPVLTPAIASRYVDDALVINMIVPPSDSNPYGFALINRVKVYEGQRISGTRLQLFEVGAQGIGVRVMGAGEKYFVEF